MNRPATSQLHAEFIERTRRLRRARGLSQAQMAIGLGIELPAYKHYEARTPLPIYLLARFALLAGCDIEYLVTGKHARGARDDETPPT